MPAAGAGPGCRPDRAAVAHHAGGAVATPKPGDAPVPCGMGTGYAGGESAPETGADADAGDEGATGGERGAGEPDQTSSVSPTFSFMLT